MSDTATTRGIACPQCKATYRIREGFKGEVRCKKCQAVIRVGFSAAESKGVKSRDRNDQKTAVKMLVMFGGALLVVAAIVAIASSKTTGGGKYDTAGSSGSSAWARPSTSSGGSGSSETNSNTPNRPPEVTPNPAPPRVGRQFLDAIVRDDRAAVREAMLFDEYFQIADTRWSSAKRGEAYADGSDDFRTKRQDLVLEELCHSFMQEVIESQLLNSLGADGTGAALAGVTSDGGRASLDYTLKDGGGEVTATMTLKLALRPGRAVSDVRTDSAWGVAVLDVRWRQPNILVDKPSSNPRDVGLGTWRDRNRDAIKAAASGPPEADPVRQEPVPGTTDAQQRELEAAVATMMDPASAGRARGAAADALRNNGKLSIPFLLNALLNVDHGNEQDCIAAASITRLLVDITKMPFDYRPGMATSAGSSVATSTEEEKIQTVRRWFGWWNRNRATWSGPPPDPEEAEEEPPTRGGRRGRR